MYFIILKRLKKASAICGKICFTLLLVGGLFSGLTVSAKMDVVTRISSTEIFLSDTITVEIDVNNAGAVSKLKLPDIPHAKVESSNAQITSSSTIINNGTITKNEIRTFHVSVTPLKIGKIAIPPIKIVAGNEISYTSEFTVNVETPPASEHMYLEIVPDKKEIYENESVTFRVKWYLRTNVENYHFLFNPFEDAEDWQFQPNPVKQNQKSIHIKDYEIPFEKSQTFLKGYEYTMYAMDIKFRSIKTGKKNISPAVIVAITEAGTENRTDMFGRVVSVPVKKRIFALTPSGSINVKPFPKDGKPDNFSGAVGNFAVNLTTDVKTASVGDKIPVTLVISGKGYFGENNEKLPGTSSELVNNFEIDIKKVYPVSENMFKTDYYFIPKNKKINSIPTLPFAYFDPQIKKYAVSISRKSPLAVTEQQIVGVNDVVLPNYRQQKQAINKGKTPETNGNYVLTVKNDFFSSQSNIMIFSIGALSLPFLGFLIGSVFVRRKVRKKLIAQSKNNTSYLSNIHSFSEKLAEQQVIPDSTYDEALAFILSARSQAASEMNGEHITHKMSLPPLSADLNHMLDEIKSMSDFLKYSGAEMTVSLKATLHKKIREFYHALKVEISGS